MHQALRRTLSKPRLAACTMAALLLAGCGDKPAAAPPKAERPAPEVGVVSTRFVPVALQSELPGRVEPVRVAQVRARVNGVVLKRLFSEGSQVRAGELLFQIDPAPYQAAQDSAAAALAKAQATLTRAAAQADRFKPLVTARAVSQQDYVNVVAAQKQAEADVDSARAALKIARINAGYANVSAPISGRIGRALVTEGALVSASEATQLALIQQMSTVYVNFTQSVGQLQRLRRQAKAAPSAPEASAPVTIVLDDGTELARKGKLLFSDVSVDPGTGQVMLRAEVPNPDNALLAGQYVRVRLSQEQLPKAVLLPQQSVTRNNGHDTVTVIDAAGKPVVRQVQVASQQNGQWVISAGLEAGELVVVDGFQKIRSPDMLVKPIPWSAARAPQ